MSIAGSEYLLKVLHALSQSFLIPVVVGLGFFFIFATVELGSLCGEYTQRRKINREKNLEKICEVESVSSWELCTLQKTIEEFSLSKRQNNLLNLLIDKAYSSEKREIVARGVLDKEEEYYQSILNKTDIISKWGPILGLMGTLIPLGPGLAALGQGDIELLSQSMMIAFDTTVLGLAIGGIGFMISKLRNKWYSFDLNYLELVIDLILSGEKIKGEKKKEREIQFESNRQ